MSMKSDSNCTEEVCSQSVLAPSTLSEPISPSAAPNSELEQPGLVSLISDSLDKPCRRPTSTNAAMRLTQRDRDIIESVFMARALRHDQIQTDLFSEGGDSRCQRRLTLLVRHQYLDRLPRNSVNEPAVYVLSRRSIAGNRMLRERHGDEEFHRRCYRLGSIQHLLAVNDIRVRVVRACRDLGWSLKLWQGPEELALRLGKGDPLPDAYFQIKRTVDGQERTSALALELERAGKSSRVLSSKLKRYGELYYSGRYAQVFGMRALRVLFVFASSDGGPTSRRVETGVGEAKRLGITIARFAGLEQITNSAPTACLTEPIWYAPSEPGVTRLFSYDQEKSQQQG